MEEWGRDSTYLSVKSQSFGVRFLSVSFCFLFLLFRNYEVLGIRGRFTVTHFREFWEDSCNRSVWSGKGR